MSQRSLKRETYLRIDRPLHIATLHGKSMVRGDRSLMKSDSLETTRRRDPLSPSHHPTSVHRQTRVLKCQTGLPALCCPRLSRPARELPDHASEQELSAGTARRRSIYWIRTLSCNPAADQELLSATLKFKVDFLSAPSSTFSNFSYLG